jgi:hypothetical protein
MMHGSLDASQDATSANRIDYKLSGQLIIKAQLNDDIRKMLIHNEDLTVNGKKNTRFRHRYQTCDSYVFDNMHNIV